MKQRPNKLAVLGLAVALAFAGAAQAADIAVPLVTSSGDIGAGTNPTPVPVNFTGDGVTVGFQAHVGFDTTNIDATVVGANGGACSVNGAGDSILIVYSDVGNLPIATGPTNFCNITFTFTGDVPAPATIALDTNTATAGDGCLDAAAAPSPTCTSTDGSITVQDINTPPTLSYAPTFDADATSDATAEVTFLGGALGQPTTSSITPTATGGAAVASTTVVCTASAGFTITGGNNQVFNSPGAGAGTPIGLSTTLTAAAQTGTLTCVETDAPTVATRTRLWDLAAPAGTVSPEFNSNPASGATLNIQGVTGATANGAVQVTNSGTADLTITGCAATGAGFTLGAVSSPIVAGGTGSINVTCAVPVTAGTNITGTLTCTTNDLDEGTITYTLSCTALSASIPTIGLAGKALLAMLMLGLGLAGFQMYRRA